MLSLPVDFATLISHAVHLAIACIVAIPIAWERERSTRIMGLRTFTVVSMGSCAYVLIGNEFANGNAEAQIRLIQGLVSGLGFIGAGAILKQNSEDGVRGTATAASVWTTGAVGTAVGFGYFSLAVMIVLFNFLAMRSLSYIKEDINGDINEDRQSGDTAHPAEGKSRTNGIPRSVTG